MKPGDKIYLACPYSHENKFIMKLRYEYANMKAAQLMRKGYVVFSPLSHSAAIAEYLPDYNHTWGGFWAKQDFPLIDWCDTLYILCLKGWKKSVGVQAEKKYAIKKGKCIVYCFRRK